MFYQVFISGFVCLLNFAIHIVTAGALVVVTRHIAGRTDDLHVFMRLTVLQMITLIVLAMAHLLEIAVWATFLNFMGITVANVTNFEFAFENYTALGYGDVVAGEGWRLIGPIMALNGLLLIGISVAIIFEVMKVANVQFSEHRKRSR